jgi:ABC-type Fe3+-siderophore transport system permease subunit
VGTQTEHKAGPISGHSASVMWSWFALFSFALILALAVGSGRIEWADLFTAEPNLGKSLFWNLRFPRALAAATVGGGLAVVGAVLQSSLRNPMADPFLLGVSSASATGAVIVLALGWESARFGSSVLAALMCLVLLDRLAYQRGVFSNHTLLIAGVALTYLLAAITGLVVTLSDPSKTRGLMFWLMGGFSSLDPVSTGICSVVLVLSSLYLYSISNDLDVLASGDEAAHVLGVRPNLLRRRLFLVSSLVVGVSVATAGGIGFVGILVPHLARMFCGVSHRQLLPLCLLGGATLTLLADTFSRTVIAPREIPVGLITALLGAPFFLHQLRKGGGW